MKCYNNSLMKYIFRRQSSYLRWTQIAKNIEMNQKNIYKTKNAVDGQLGPKIQTTFLNFFSVKD